MNHFIKERINNINKIKNITITFIIYSLGMGLLIPIFNIRINEITNSLEITSIIFLISSITRTLTDIPVSKLTSIMRPNKLLAISLIITAITTMNYVLITNTTQLIINTIINSMSTSGILISGWVIIRSKTKNNHAQEEISQWVTMQAIAYSITPMIGSLIIKKISWAMTYVITTIILIMAAITTKKIKIRKQATQRTLKTIKEVISNKQLRRLAILTLSTLTIITTYNIYLPLKLQEEKQGILNIGLIMTIGTTIPYILLPTPIGIISDKYGRKKSTIISLVITAIGVMATTMSHTTITLLISSLLTNSGVAVISTSFNAEINDKTPRKKLPLYTAVFEIIKDAGTIIGPAITTITNNINITYQALSILSLLLIITTKKIKNF